ncbi:MAG: BBP7 family outer membrane beta-barrel protein, partial [Burkholderiaceae bacterium]|nr:BBP7 family outer membrane beta-barrel protein [Burkholderiaceae bacterium]
MKNLLLSLSLAGLCFSQASAQVTHPQPSARHIGDGVRSVGDSNRYVPESEDQRPESFKPKNGVARSASYSSSADGTLLAPAAAESIVRQASYMGNAGLVSRGSATDLWLSAETLLWFSDNQKSPPLITTAASGVRPVAGAMGVTTNLGGPDGIERGILPGFRLAGGKFLGEDQKVGVGGRVFGIFSNETTYTATSDGSTSLGLPFYNLQLQTPDAFLVAFHDGIETVSAGTASARSDLDMIGADGSLHLLLGRSSNHRADLLIGYTYNRLKNSIGVTSTSTNLSTTDAIADGTVFYTNDLFETQNDFNGAHLGVLSNVTANRVSLSTLAKVSFGNMRQTSAIRGFTTETLGAVTNGYAGGLLTQTSNIGTMTRDTFAFIPEMGIKLGYAPQDNIHLTIGYTFMF